MISFRDTPDHEYLHVYASRYSNFKRSRNPLDLSDEVKARYRNPDDDPRGPWQSISANAQAGHGTKDQFYDLVAPNGRVHGLPAGRCWILTERRMREQIADNRVWFGKDGNGVPRIKKFLSEVKGGLTPNTLWLADEVGTNDSAKKHTIRLFDGKEVFETPKPEALVQRVLEIATDPGDLVLDSFLGSGTTAAVAHKMGRRWIGIEMGEHAVTHCVPRLRKVIEGEQGGISRAVDWKGGGGFRFYRLGPRCSIRMGTSVTTHDTWQGAVSGAIAARASLAESAKEDTDYIRPLVLFQAQPRNQEVTVGALKTYLTEHEGIPLDRIAVATGDQRELDGIDLFDRACPDRVRHHHRGAQGRMGMLLRLRLLLRRAHSQRGGRGTASRPRAPDALRGAAPGPRPQQGVRLRLRAHVRGGGAGACGQAGGHGLRGGRRRASTSSRCSASLAARATCSLRTTMHHRRSGIRRPRRPSSRPGSGRSSATA